MADSKVTNLQISDDIEEAISHFIMYISANI